jgi:hypothetical protein
MSLAHALAEWELALASPHPMVGLQRTRLNSFKQFRITDRLTGGSQNHKFSFKNSTFWPASVLFVAVRTAVGSRTGYQLGRF